jgi:hypothetical protein
MASHPPGIRRGIPSLTLIHTFIDRAYSRFAIAWTASRSRRGMDPSRDQPFPSVSSAFRQERTLSGNSFAEPFIWNLFDGCAMILGKEEGL